MTNYSQLGRRFSRYNVYTQWNPSCEATPFASEKRPFKRGGLLSGWKSIHLCLDLHCQVAFPEGWPLVRVASQKGFHFIYIALYLPYWLIDCLFVVVKHRFLTSEVILQQCLLVAVVFGPMCCHTGMPCRRHRTWHPNPSQYTDTGTTCRCAIHWCGTSHWKPQQPILMSWVRYDQEIIPPPSTRTSERSTLWCLFILLNPSFQLWNWIECTSPLITSDFHV